VLFHAPYEFSIFFGAQDLPQSPIKGVSQILIEEVSTGSNPSVDGDEDAPLDDAAGIGVLRGEIKLELQAAGESPKLSKKPLFLFIGKAFRFGRDSVNIEKAVQDHGIRSHLRGKLHHPDHLPGVSLIKGYIKVDPGPPQSSPFPLGQKPFDLRDDFLEDLSFIYPEGDLTEPASEDILHMLFEKRPVGGEVGAYPLRFRIAYHLKKLGMKEGLPPPMKPNITEISRIEDPLEILKREEAARYSQISSEADLTVEIAGGGNLYLKGGFIPKLKNQRTSAEVL